MSCQRRSRTLRTRSRRASRSRNNSATCGWCATIRALLAIIPTLVIAAVLYCFIVMRGQMPKKKAIIHGKNHHEDYAADYLADAYQEERDHTRAARPAQGERDRVEGRRRGLRRLIYATNRRRSESNANRGGRGDSIEGSEASANRGKRQDPGTGPMTRGTVRLPARGAVYCYAYCSPYRQGQARGVR